MTAVFSNNVMDFTATTASYEIRSGVSSGNGGTLLFSGTAAATQVATGRSGFGLNEFTIQISGLNIFLAPGTYFLNVAPIDSVSGQSYNTGTVGANSVGSPPGNNGNEFWWSSQFLANYTAQAGDFSNGVIGTVVPEPATWALLGLGALLVAVRRRRAA